MMSTTTNGKATTRNGNLADGNGRPETHNNMLQDCATPREVINALRLVAQHFDGEHGVWAYDVFDAINASYFEGRLPTPKIQWALTAHGRCLGLTRSTARPVVTLHPSLLGGSELRNPWGVDPEWLGIAYAFDVLLHESIHVSQHYMLGGGIGPTSHNNTVWIAEVNRIAPMLRLAGIEAGGSKTRRVPIEGETTKTGKPATRVIRVNEGNVPYSAVCRFPHGAREYMGTADSFYRAKILPVTCNNMLQA
jgi:hypothetical protein